jgi:hypothetical protein
VLCLLALVLALVFWALNSGGGGGGHGSGASSGSHTPDATITPGPTPSGPHISGQPGGRDSGGSTDGGASSGDASTGGASNGGSGVGSSSGATAGDGAGDGGADDGSTAGQGSGGAGSPNGVSSAGGQEVPADSSLPNCSPGQVTLSLTSVKNAYSPGQDPEFRLSAANSGSVTCKLDFGPKSAVFTVTKAADSGHVWASDDCPTAGPNLLQVPAHAAASYTTRWNGKTSSPKCAKPKGGQAAPGTYLVQARMAGYGTKQVSFVLAQD